MPAIVRGQAVQGAKAAKAKPKSQASAASRRRAAATYAQSGLFTGIPPQLAAYGALGVLSLTLVAALATGGRGRALANMATGAVVDAFERTTVGAGFFVREVDIEGATPTSQADLRRAIGVEIGKPILTLDLAKIRKSVESVGWAKAVKVARYLPGEIKVVVTERVRSAVWQHSGRFAVIDNEGQIIPEADPAQFPNLPLVVGEGANGPAYSLISSLQTRPKLLGLIDAIIRVDGRRWDLRLHDGGLIQLPAENEDAALIQLDRLDRDHEVLNLGFSRIDLRTGDPIVRPKGASDATVQSTASVG